MRRITLAIMSTISGLVLLFSYHTSRNAPGELTTAPADLGAASGASPEASVEPTAEASPQATDDQAADQSDDAASATPSETAAPPPTPTPTPTKKATPATRTVAGETAWTHWGPVQVKITIKNGRIIKSDVLQVPWDNPRDQEINSQAVPILNQQAVDAGNAHIDGVSGATVTSDGYRQSLQSAIDKAHL